MKTSRGRLRTTFFSVANVRLNPFQSRYYEPAPGRNGYAGVTLAYHFR